MQYGVQTVSMAVILTIMLNYFRSKRMPLLSSNLFGVFISLAFCNVLFEFATLFTIYRIESISPWINRLCHQLFIGALDVMVFFLFLYVDLKARKMRRYGLNEFLIRILPIACAFLVIIFGRLEYYIGPDGRYSYGPMAVTVYSTIFIYVAFIVGNLIKYKDSFAEQECRTIMHGVLIWLIIAVIQIIKPTLLMSSMGVAIMVLFVYISFENPREFTDYEVKYAFNKKAYEMILNESMSKKQSFKIISVAIVNEKLLQNTYSNQEVFRLLEKSAEYLTKNTKMLIFHSERNRIAIVAKKKKAYKKLMSENILAELKKHIHEVNEHADLRVSILKCPDYAEEISAAENIISFVNSNSYNLNNEDVIVINKDVADKFNYYVAVERIVQKALKEDGFEVYYQPIYSTKEKRFLSAEALVRFKDKETLGYISPEVFIPIAEKSNMIGELGRIVFEKVCRFYKENNLSEKGIEYIEVNLSGKQIVDKQLPDMLLQCINQYGLNPRNINLEITETAAVEAEDILQDNMKILQEAGFGFSMDDFGTGYSNLSKMADADFDLIKLDKSLLWPCFEANNSGALVIFNSCVDMIHNLGKHIVAEGVETKEQADMLTQKGVAYLQGYYFSRPLPEQGYLEFMDKVTVN